MKKIRDLGVDVDYKWFFYKKHFLTQVFFLIFSIFFILITHFFWFDHTFLQGVVFYSDYDDDNNDDCLFFIPLQGGEKLEHSEKSTCFVKFLVVDILFLFMKTLKNSFKIE